MRLGQLAEETREGSALDITPLIDIVFILLIFFVVTTTFVHDLGIDVERPQASTAREQPSEIVRVAVSERGEVTVDARPTSSWRIEAEVRDRLTGARDGAVLLVADKGVHAETLVSVMDACRRAGASSVALAVEAGASP
ncbi:MAG: biopolymer transporter ExbD [Deltaproteobacteria bacterium]|nr:biopolymer transporter ExbD [Deltaproteobacteria bacterium]MBK8234950.1 biopolymer transporter ExbD [Deltaproteobacteria bacterium]MBK8716738.1 biopolymer transporter ExbD [Deltaproteobacteria bacterium]MBP7285295.1 biopolymer transporter ExbD [Nannocystaceae bacterium]